MIYVIKSAKHVSLLVRAPCVEDQLHPLSTSAGTNHTRRYISIILGIHNISLWFTYHINSRLIQNAFSPWRINAPKYINILWHKKRLPFLRALFNVSVPGISLQWTISLFSAKPVTFIWSCQQRAVHFRPVSSNSRNGKRSRCSSSTKKDQLSPNLCC